MIKNFLLGDCLKLVACLETPFWGTLINEQSSHFMILIIYPTLSNLFKRVLVNAI